MANQTIDKGSLKKRLRLFLFGVGGAATSFEGTTAIESSINYKGKSN